MGKLSSAYKPKISKSQGRQDLGGEKKTEPFLIDNSTYELAWNVQKKNIFPEWKLYYVISKVTLKRKSWIFLKSRSHFLRFNIITILQKAHFKSIAIITIWSLNKNLTQTISSTRSCVSSWSCCVVNFINSGNPIDRSSLGSRTQNALNCDSLRYES